MAKVNWKVILILIIAIVVVVIALAVLLSGKQSVETDIPETTPTNGTKCRTDDDTSGVCVPYGQCASTSRLDKNMIRFNTENGCERGLWCCPEILRETNVTTNTNTKTTPTNGTKCRTDDDTSGVCVPHDQCASTSPLDKNMIRFNTQNGCDGLLCCPETQLKANVPTDINTRGLTHSCTSLSSDICPWCVTLHKVKDKSQMATEAFCMGSLISTKIILTAASCLKASEKFTLFARVPASIKKTKNYYAKMRLSNPVYDSVTRYNDFGLIILYEMVDWGNKEPLYACFNYEEINGNCMTFGLDSNDNFVSTIIEPTEDKCTAINGGESLEVVCGKNTDESICFVTLGAPVVCQTSKSGSNRGELMGVVRSTCVKNEILLGQLAGSIMWLNPMLPYLTNE